jgi:DNA-directed RNA polymerase sigma subunit (sigma70/sigma32)
MAELFLDQGDAIATRSTGAVNLEDDVMARAAASPILTAESGLTRYLEELRRFSMLEPHEEFMLATRWREQGDREAAHRLVPAICAWSPRSPWGTAATACRSPR